MRYVSKVRILLACAALASFSPWTARAQDLKPRKVRDGEAAIIKTTLPEAEATAKVKAYFNGKNIDFTVN